MADAEIYTYAHVVILEKRKNSRIVKAFVDVVNELLSQDRTGIEDAPDANLGHGEKRRIVG